MAIAVEERPRPLKLRPLVVQTRSVPFVDADSGSAAPPLGFPQPQPMLPNSADEERVSEIDQEALRNLRSFNSQPSSYSASGGFEFNPLSSNFSDGCFERRHTLASPLTPYHPGFNSPATPNAHDFARRQSAPFASHHGVPEPSAVIVVPQQLTRPESPLVIANSEIWWPVQDNGDIKIHVGIMNRRGQAEKLTRCFPPNRLSSNGHCRSPASPQTPFGSWPGSVLPMPGESPGTLGRRLCVGWSPSSPHLPRSRRASYFNCQGKAILKERAVCRLNLLGAIVTQTKRPIHPTEEILMPMPYPIAWPDTVDYVHTGDDKYLSETVKMNLVHLGGRY